MTGLRPFPDRVEVKQPMRQWLLNRYLGSHQSNIPYILSVVPTVMSILKVTTVEEIDNLQVSTAQKFKPRNFVPVPPFLVNSISSAISASKGNAKVVLLATVPAIMDFDASHIGDDEYYRQSEVQAFTLLAFLSHSKQHFRSTDSE